MKTYWDEMIFEMEQKFREKREAQARQLEQPDPPSKEDWDSAVREGTVSIQDHVIELQWHQLLDGQVHIALPSFLNQLPHKLLFPDRISASHDELIYANDKRDLSFGIRHLSHTLQKDYIVQYRNHLIKLAATTRTDMQAVDTLVLESEGQVIAQFESIVKMEPDPYYQVSWVTELQERVLLGSFQCKLQEAAIWQPLWHAVIRQMRITPVSIMNQ